MQATEGRLLHCGSERAYNEIGTIETPYGNMGHPAAKVGLEEG